MIPRTIHYCWFGGKPLTEMAQKCIASWKRYCPDYEIVRWDESNFDLDYNAYVREAYQMEKWAFVTDVVRLYALVTYGGIYLDTDVEVLKPLDGFLRYDAFSGFESDDRVPTGIMASIQGQKLFKELLHDYDDKHFLNSAGKPNLVTNVTRISNICLKYGLILDNSFQTINGLTLFPKDYFCPKDCKTHELRLTDRSFTIHHFDGSWITEEDRLTWELARKYRRYLPNAVAEYLARFVAVKEVNGYEAAVQYVGNWLQRKLKRKCNNDM